MKRMPFSIITLLLISLLAAGCGPGTPAAMSPTSPAIPSELSKSTAPPAVLSVLATPGGSAALSALPTATVPAPLSPEPAGDGLRLVVLHTNDNWGETEPCG